MITFILIWVLLGSVAVNCIWAIRYKQGYFKRKYRTMDYTKGILGGLLLGPLCFLVVLTLKE